jgi:hypothetical protein
MAPAAQRLPAVALPIRHSLFRRDINDGTIVSLIIAVVILSILTVGASIYLCRQLWAKHIQPRRHKHDSKPMTETSSVRDSYLSTSTVEKEAEKNQVYKKAGRARSYSDDLWSTQLDKETSEGDDDDARNDLLKRSSRQSRHARQSRYSKRKSFHFLSMSLTSGSLGLSRSQHSLTPPLPDETEPPLSELPSESEEQQVGAIGMAFTTPEKAEAVPEVVRSRTPFEHETTPTKSTPLHSHPVDVATLHRCTSSFDAGRKGAERRKSVGRFEIVELE